jgi:RsiW-degrading membrane proteinase PrsW (M82 family)
MALGEGYYKIGTAPGSNIVSDDAEVLASHAVLGAERGVVSVQPSDGADVFVDGVRISGAVALKKAQQLRVGRSLWRLTNARGETPPDTGVFSKWSARVSAAAGLERIQGFSASDLFSDVFKKRSDEEVEEYFVAGTMRTTPDLATVGTDWPKPWAFARIFLFSVAAYALLVYGFREFGNPYFIPGVMVIGSLAFPLTILVFFYEMNVPRNVSLLFLLKWLVFGGVISLLVALFGFRVSNLSSWLGSMSAGIVEESAKLAALLMVVGARRYRWTLNGLLIGAAIGTGFSVFETMGYVFVQGFVRNGLDGMFSIITSRGWLNLLGDHSLWTGLVGAALWRVRGNQAFRFDMLRDPRFLRVFGLAIALHMVNNAPVPVPLFGKYLAIGFVAWVGILSFIQYGLREVRAEQVSKAA